MPRKKATKKTLHATVRHAAKSVVVPHRKNQYRPHLIRGHGIAIVVAVVMAAQLSYNFVQTGSVLGQKTEVRAAELLTQTNRERAENGAGDLRLSTQLNKAAQLKIDDMFKQQYWAHTAPDGATPWQWFEQAGYKYSTAGENLAKDFHSSAGVVTAWMNSSEHRKNLLESKYTDVGFAVKQGELNGEQTTLVVALYGQPTGSVAQLATDRQAVLAANDVELSPIARLGVGLQSMTPALLGSIVVLTLVAGIGLVAHAYRNKLPREWRLSWKRHHGLYKAAGAMTLVVSLITLYGGGQI